MTQENTRREAQRYSEMLQKRGFLCWNGERFVWVYSADKQPTKEKN